VNGNTVLFFETENGWDVSGGSELLPSNSRHHRVTVVAFADGHVEMVPPARLVDLRWNP
jgi:prepilin-type processing-associated H-X9-DG protein